MMIDPGFEIEGKVFGSLPSWEEKLLRKMVPEDLYRQYVKMLIEFEYVFLRQELR